ncbi:MAG: flagellar motor protein MotB, partial [Bryobacteraceae bacterium]
MARRRRIPSHENHERWLVSYADFITLLFAFFVVMFASSQADKGKAQQMSDSIKRALKDDQVASAIYGILGGAVGIKAQGNSQMKGPGGAEV